MGPDNLWLAYVLLVALSLFAAVFDPASSAALPNVVDPEDLPTANALSGSLWGTMLAVGAAAGGVVATLFGRNAAFTVDAVSFAISALLLLGVRRAFSATAGVADEHVGIAEATRETVRYARQDARVWALVSVKFGFGAAAGVLALIAVFAKDIFHAGDVGFGLLMAARGVGALIGPFLGHRLAGPGHRRLLPVIACSLATFGVGYALLGVAPALWLAARRDPRRAPGRRVTVGAVELRAAAAGARPDPRADLRLRLRVDHAVARRLQPDRLDAGRPDRRHAAP